MEISDKKKQKIIDLYLNSRLTFTQIIDNVFPNEGATLEDLISVLEEYQSSVGHRIKRNRFTNSIRMNKDIIKNEDIFEMVERGFTDSQIRDYYVKKDCSITEQAINMRKLRVYKNKGLPVPKVSEYKRMEKKKQIEFEEKRKKELKEQKKKEENQMIFSLREDGLSYEQIKNELGKKDLHFNTKTIKKRYFQYCNEKGIEPIKFKNGLLRGKNIDKNEVYRLIKEGFSLTQIAEKYDTNPVSIMNICKKVFKEKNEEMPNQKKYFNLPKQELIELKDLGFSVKDITEYYKDKDIVVANTTVLKKLRKAYLEKGEKMPRAKNKIGKVDLQYVDKNILKKFIDKMRVTKNATDEQIEELYEYYGIEKTDKEKDER